MDGTPPPNLTTTVLAIAVPVAPTIAAARAAVAVMRGVNPLTPDLPPSLRGVGHLGPAQEKKNGRHHAAYQHHRPAMFGHPRLAS